MHCGTELRLGGVRDKLQRLGGVFDAESRDDHVINGNEKYKDKNDVVEDSGHPLVLATVNV